MSDVIDQAKRALRADLRERRQNLSDAARTAAGIGIASQLDALVAATGARSVSCFLSMTTEPDTRPFVRDAVARGIRVLLPVTRVDGLLDWAVATADGEIAEGLSAFPSRWVSCSAPSP
jgi:5-formyltetrahydrofolate cyclo-ligase